MSASSTTGSPLAWNRSRLVIIKSEEMRLVPVGDIVVDEGRRKVLMVVLDGHPYDAVLCVRGVAHLVLQLLGPFITCVAVSAVEFVCAPRISELNKSLATASCGHTKNGVSVAIDDTKVVFLS